ncbi:recombination mediator RecR [Candidatus Arthromitus sp. SFB-turkey]|uniref:recombination mediator RecR n=1 Tax=Candidatus Arthromitus sp. SFB-turkey TaxID=1840217 RepID=UPI0007F4110B|nr:recombination mediator RecR [Candidatus Arthromitus sp. SFB-turkey]OAT88991.1 recombination protein RecR [Candidatus Arthromitus sp. SFB-turkey]HJD00199.1 recombination mediator RecR [Candidatus Dwaynia gallinarum]
MNDYPKYLQDIIAEFSKLPGIGYKTAVRLSMYVINKNLEDVMKFSDAIKNCKINLKYCEKCGNFSEERFCFICSDKSRDVSIICVVQDVKDIYAFEKTRNFNGVYHVLHGVISPSKGIGPDSLNIDNLIKRIKEEKIQEIILSTSPTLEGEATSVYISKLLFGENLKITRLAYGVPLGSDLEYVDEITLSKALDFRQKI